MDKKVHYKMHKVKKQWVTIAVTGMSLGAVSAVSLGTNDGVVQAHGCYCSHPRYYC